MKNKEKLYIMSYELDSTGKITSIGMGVIKDNCPEIVGYIQPEMLGYFTPKEDVFVFVPNSSNPSEKDIKSWYSNGLIHLNKEYEEQYRKCKKYTTIQEYEKDLKLAEKSMLKLIKEITK